MIEPDSVRERVHQEANKLISAIRDVAMRIIREHRGLGRRLRLSAEGLRARSLAARAGASVTAEIDWKGIRWRLACDSVGCDVVLCVHVDSTDDEAKSEMLSTASGHMILLLAASLEWEIEQPPGPRGRHLCPRCARVAVVDREATR